MILNLVQNGQLGGASSLLVEPIAYRSNQNIDKLQ